MSVEAGISNRVLSTMLWEIVIAMCYYEHVFPSARSGQQPLIGAKFLTAVQECIDASFEAVFPSFLTDQPENRTQTELFNLLLTFYELPSRRNCLNAIKFVETMPVPLVGLRMILPNVPDRGITQLFSHMH